MSESILPAAAVPARPPVSPRTRHGLAVAGAAVALGTLGDALLRPLPWGLNLTLWSAALIAAAVGLQQYAETEDAATGWIPVALTVAALMAWRDSPALKGLDLTALCIILGLAVWRTRGGAVRASGLARTTYALLEAAGEAMFGALPLVFSDVKWREIPREGWTRHALAAVRGIAIALPLLLLFGSLLVAADAAFDSLVSSTFNLDVPLATSHLLLALTFAWIAAGVLRGLVMRPLPRDATGTVPAPAFPRPSLGIVEIATVLGLLDALFLAFVLVQLPHFFGSYDSLLAPGTATFSEYARRGFFELCTVAALVLPLLMGMHWLLRKEEPRAERVFRIVGGVMVGLVFVIIASGLHRMGLYLSAYGLTELRVYTTAFMLWLAAVFAWFAWTVLRGRRERFTFGALTAAVETVVLLHVANPDALIVRVNASRHDAPVQFDAVYAATLSGDAVPALLRRLDAVPSDARCGVARRLLHDWSGADEDWRAWSLGRSAAVAAVRSRAAALAAMCPARVAAR